ncbi:MAG: Signal peptidase I [uncultured Rubrobacteraceae bacterium]|uniref:Signal peptidase I n=1 Tax=uncultured Rubrobacteraceae bacterium TaxID=349277 RepID=A0A6J4RAI2_9ACTN|nr:MAG: Signal peptidase I [uncultured Rubrobacteraceae bacterium]
MREEEVPESRRELRRQRRKERGLAGLIARLRVPGRSKKGAEKLPPGEAVPKSRRELRAERRKKKGSGPAEFVVTIIVAFVLVFGVVQPFIVQAFRIPSASMVPTLEIKDRILANKFIYRFAEPERGDIVVFDSVENGDDDTLIKRVVGLEGDEIRVQGGLLFVNGEPQEEPYLNEEESFRGYYGPATVPEDHVFVMGDNRGNSADSRVFGPVPLDNIKGEAFVRFWPISKIGDL